MRPLTTFFTKFQGSYANEEKRDKMSKIGEVWKVVEDDEVGGSLQVKKKSDKLMKLQSTG